MTGYQFKQGKTILYGRKCTKCGKHSREGDFYAHHHWYCSVCRPLDDYEVRSIKKEVTEVLKALDARDAEYKKQLRMHKLQISKELI